MAWSLDSSHLLVNREFVLYGTAAFYAGAMAHYLGDLSKFMHIMGAKSHWKSENQDFHHKYEVVADDNIEVAMQFFATWALLDRS